MTKAEIRLVNEMDQKIVDVIRTRYTGFELEKYDSPTGLRHYTIIHRVTGERWLINTLNLNTGKVS